MFTRLLDWVGDGKYNILFPQRDYRKVLNWMPYKCKLVQLSRHPKERRKTDKFVSRQQLVSSRFAATV